MRSARHVLFFALYFMILTSSASAECGWLMWKGTRQSTWLGQRTLVWALEAPYDSLDRCKGEAQAIVVGNQIGLKDRGIEVTNFPQGNGFTVYQSAKATKAIKPPFLERVQCFPDSVDPRGK